MVSTEPKLNNREDKEPTGFLEQSLQIKQGFQETTNGQGFSTMKTSLQFNKRLTALALLTVTSVGGAMLAVKHVSAQDTQARRVKDVTLWDRTNHRGVSFDSNSAVADLSLRGFDDRASSIAVNNDQTWRFYRHKNFQGSFIEIGPGESREDIGRLNNRVSSFRVVRGRW